MADIKRVVSTAFWTDEKTVEDFSPEDKYFFLYLLTNPHTTQLGIYKVSPKVMAFELGYDINAVLTLIDRFQNRYGQIRYNPETREIAIKNYLIYSVVKGGKPVYDLLCKEVKAVRDRGLLAWVVESLRGKVLNQTVTSFLEVIEKFDLPIFNENDNDNENENENENDDTPPVREAYRPPYAERTEASAPIPYEDIKSAYNEICKSFPRCTVLSEARKKAIKARFSSGYKEDDFQSLFMKAEASSFLKGRNDRNWMASFDWLIKDANMAKVLSGNYDDHGGGQGGINSSDTAENRQYGTWV